MEVLPKNLRGDIIMIPPRRRHQRHAEQVLPLMIDNLRALSEGGLKDMCDFV